MKKIYLLVVLLMVVSTINAQDSILTDNEVKWEASFKMALKKAKKEHKPLLIYFTGSDWCPPCKTLDKNLFHSEKFKEFSKDNFVLYLANFPRNRDLVNDKMRKVNEGLSIRYAQTKFPTMIVINEKGEVLGRKTGAYVVEYYYPFFESIIKDHYKRNRS